MYSEDDPCHGNLHKTWFLHKCVFCGMLIAQSFKQVLPMSRITIDVTAEEHQKLKALAALQGLTIKDYVLGNTIRSARSDEEAALSELEEMLDKRIQQFGKQGSSERTVSDIFNQAYRESESEKGA